MATSIPKSNATLANIPVRSWVEMDKPKLKCVAQRGGVYKSSLQRRDLGDLGRWGVRGWDPDPPGRC